MSAIATGSPLQPAPSFVLRVSQGPNMGETYRITPPGAVIGRDPDSCQIALNDPRVSRQQCRIDFKMDMIVAEDLSGKSTTLVNQKPITTAALFNGDVISFGDTHLVFSTSLQTQKAPALSAAPARSAPAPFSAPAALASGFPQPVSEGPPLNKNFLMVVGVVVLLVVGFLMIPAGAKKKGPRVATPESQDAAIEAIQKRQEELQKPTSNMTDQELYNRRGADKHYIRGQRDFQNGKYTRALEAFQTALATDPSHAMARRYYRLSEKKRMDMVDYHLDLGNKWKKKSMYKYCMAEFEKVLQIINQPSHKKYQLAKEQIKECRLSLQGSN